MPHLYVLRVDGVGFTRIKSTICYALFGKAGMAGSASSGMAGSASAGMAGSASAGPYAEQFSECFFG